MAAIQENDGDVDPTVDAELENTEVDPRMNQVDATNGNNRFTNDVLRAVVLRLQDEDFGSCLFVAHSWRDMISHVNQRSDLVSQHLNICHAPNLYVEVQYMADIPVQYFDYGGRDPIKMDRTDLRLRGYDSFGCCHMYHLLGKKGEGGDLILYNMYSRYFKRLPVSTETRSYDLLLGCYSNVLEYFGFQVTRTASGFEFRVLDVHMLTWTEREELRFRLLSGGAAAVARGFVFYLGIWGSAECMLRINVRTRSQTVHRLPDVAVVNSICCIEENVNLLVIEDPSTILVYQYDIDRNVWSPPLTLKLSPLTWDTDQRDTCFAGQHDSLLMVETSGNVGLRINLVNGHVERFRVPLGMSLRCGTVYSCKLLAHHMKTRFGEATPVTDEERELYEDFYATWFDGDREQVGYLPAR